MNKIVWECLAWKTGIYEEDVVKISKVMMDMQKMNSKQLLCVATNTRTNKWILQVTNLRLIKGDIPWYSVVSPRELLTTQQIYEGMFKKNM